MLNQANLVGFWRVFVRRLTGVGSFLYQRFKRRTPDGKVRKFGANRSTENRVDPHGVDPAMSAGGGGEGAGDAGQDADSVRPAAVNHHSQLALQLAVCITVRPTCS